MSTIDDVARIAGVSKSTVSRAFTRPDSVRNQTRQLVLRAAEEAGYRPNRSAQLLAGARRTGCLGLFVPDIGSPTVPELIKAVQYHARMLDNSVFVADSDEHIEDEFTIVQAMARQVDGLVLGSPRMSEDKIRAVAAIVPVVTVERHVPGVPAILYGDEGMRQAVEHLYVLGHRRIGYLAGPTASSANVHRQAAVLSAAQDYGIEVSEFGPFQPRLEEGIRAADIIAASDVTAVIAFNDLIALGAGIPPLRRGTASVSLVGVDDSWVTDLAEPPLTSVRRPVNAAGARAVRTLQQIIEGHPVEPSTVVLPTELIVRGSTRPPSPRGIRPGQSSSSS